LLWKISPTLVSQQLFQENFVVRPASGISAISNEQERSSSSLSNILTVATFFSGVTGGTLSMSVGNGEQTRAIQVSSMLWFGSLAFSVGAAFNSLLAMAWKETKS